MRLPLAKFLPPWLVLCASAATAAAPENTQEWRDYTNAYAQCMVWRHHQPAAALILNDVDDETAKSKYTEIFSVNYLLANFECNNLNIRPGSDFILNLNELRFALAKQLVLQDLTNFNKSDFSDVPALSHRPAQSLDALKRLTGLAAQSQAEKLDKIRQGDVALVWLAYFGECVARHDPANTKAWLFSKSASRDEAGILQALSPSFSACLTEGQKINFNREMLRGAVAVNFYRLAMAKPASAGAVH